MKKYKNLIAVIAAFSLLTACGSTPQESTESASVSVSETTPTVSVISSAEDVSSVGSSAENGSMGLSFDETDLLEAITGLEDIYVVQGAENINYLDNVIYDNALILSITWDASQVDLETPGEYPLTYVVTVNQDAMDAYLGGTYDPAQDYRNSSTVEVVIEKTVTVCTAEDSTAQADAGIYVLADDGQYAETSDGKQPAARHPVKPASTDVTGGTPICADTGEKPEVDLAQPTPQASTEPASPSPSDKTDASASPTSSQKPDDTTATPKPSSAATPKPSTSAKPSTPSSTPAPTATPKPSKTPSPTPSPTHTHTWVTQEATGHYEKVQTGTIHHDAITHVEEEWRMIYKCNSCGQTFSSANDVVMHQAFGDGSCNAGYSQWEELVNSYTVVDQEAWDEPVYENVWVEDTPAYEYCSGCGQRR